MDASLAELVIEHLPVALVVLDAQDRVVRTNAAGRIAFGDPTPGTALTDLAGELDVRALPGTELRLGCLLAIDAERLSELTHAAGETGTLAHDLKNASSAISLSLRAVAHALGEDEQEVLHDMHARLATIERRIRIALSDR